MSNNKVLRGSFALHLASLILASGAMSQAKAQAPKSLRLYVFDGGSLNIPDTSPYRLKKEDLATTYMSVACFLVVHPKGTLMWDAGAVPDSAIKPGGSPGAIRYATAMKPLGTQLAEV